jgi:hypothetical protein
MAYELRPQSVSLTPQQAVTLYPTPTPAPVTAYGVIPYADILGFFLFIIILAMMMSVLKGALGK